MAEVDRSTFVRRLAIVLVPTYVLVLLSFVLPEIALDGWLADLAVAIADTGSWRQMPFVVLAAVLVLISRPGLSKTRRAAEALATIMVMLVFVGGNAQLNEAVIKPSLAIPRPNLIALAEHNELGMDVEEFYALGDKQVRRGHLESELANLESPRLGPDVHAHWVEETGYSFPSGHATASITFATLMVALGLAWTTGWRRTVITTAIPAWAVLVVYSRPLLRVHSAVDVSFGALVGIVLGILGFLVLRWLIELLEKIRPRRPETPRAT